jgi:hypothetical protein
MANHVTQFKKGQHPNATSFKKGSQGNPSGRPPTLKTQLLKFADSDYDVFYDKLMEGVNRGDAKFLELFHRVAPKCFKEKCVPVDQDTSSVDAQLTSLRKALLGFDALTLDELLNTIKTLSATKFAEIEAKRDAETTIDRKATLAKIDELLEGIGHKENS